MLTTRTRSRGAPRVVDVASLLGLDDSAPISAREIDVPRGAAGLQRLDRLAHPAIVVEGVIMRTIVLGRRTSAALHGTGDVLSCSQPEPPPFAVRCRALTPARIAIIDERTTAAIAADPRVASAIAGRVGRHNDELVLQSVITQLVSIEERLGVLLPHLADRWGTVSHEGVILPAFLSHTILAALVGVRRPSLTTAIATLAADALFTRLPDRRWLVAPALAGLATSAAAPAQ